VLRFEQRVIGLDVGATTVKLVALRRGKDGPEVLGAGAASLPEGAMNETGVADSELVAGVIQEALAEARVEGRVRRAVAGIAGRYLTVRALTVPTMDHSELREAVKWEMAQYLPYPVEESVFDFVELGPGASSGTIEVLSVTTRRTVVDGFIQAIELARLEPVALDAVPFALGRVFVPEPDEYAAPGILQAAAALDGAAEEVVAVADLGADGTEISVFRRGRLRVSRSIPIGGARFTAAIAKELNLSRPDAEEAKIRGTAAVGRAVEEVAAELAEELQRSLDYFRAQTHWLPVSRVHLTGGGARLRGLDRLLADHLGTRVDAGPPRETLPGRLGEAVAAGGVPPVALGLALWEVNRA
jgi:type IV pilus assembly protein PilM